MSRIVQFTVHKDMEILGRTPIMAQAVEAAKGYAESHNCPVTVTATYADGRMKDVEYHPDGYIKRIWAIAESTPFFPEEGTVYRNSGGGEYLCQRANGPDARMINVSSGWSFTAHGCRRYFDGSIEWDWSSDGCFGKIPEVTA